MHEYPDKSFWAYDNAELPTLPDEELGRKAREVWKALKPFAQRDLLRPTEYRSTKINLSKELRSDLNYNKSEYLFSVSQTPNGDVLDPVRRNIWLKSLQDAHDSVKPRVQIPLPLAAIGSDTSATLKEIYEGQAKELTGRRLTSLAKSSDLLDQVLFLYIVKRAQNGDADAADKLYSIYEKAAEAKGVDFIKNLEARLGWKFKQDGELGIDNVRRMAKTFLRMLIAGGEPENLFQYVKMLDDPRNVEIIFTRTLGKKIKDACILAKEFIEDHLVMDKLLESAQQKLIRDREAEMSIFPSDEVDAFKKRVKSAIDQANKTEHPQWFTYQDFLPAEEMTETERKLHDVMKKYDEVYYGKIIPTRGIIREQIDAMSNPLMWIAAGNWYNDKLYDASKNPSFTTWLLGNPKTRVPSALVGLLQNWVKASSYSYVGPDPNPPKKTKRFFRREYLEAPYKVVDPGTGAGDTSMDDGESEERDGLENFGERAYEAAADTIGEVLYGDQAAGSDLSQWIVEKYAAESGCKPRDRQIVQTYEDRKLKGEKPMYQDIATEHDLSERHVIRVCMKFEAWKRAQVKP